MTKNPDTPQVHVELKTPLFQETQRLPIQGNRVDPRERFAWVWMARLYPPASGVDFALDAVTYVCSSALIASIGRHVVTWLLTPIGSLVAFTIFIGVQILCQFISREVTGGRQLLTYRGVLISIGVVIGGVL